MMTWLPSEVVKLFQHVACEMRDEAHGYAQVQRCMRRGVRRERAAERGGGHLARARVRTMGPCAL